MVSVIGIIILHLLRHNKELQRKKIKPLYRELVIQNIGNSLSAEPLLAEMFRQDRGWHFFQISHLIDRNTIADYLLQVRRSNILRFPDLIPAFLLLILLIHGCNDLLRMFQKAQELLKCLALLIHWIIPASFQACQIFQQFFLCIYGKIAADYFRHFAFICCRFHGFVILFIFLCLAVRKLLTITIPVDHFLWIMEIKILLLQHPCQKVWNILRAHAKPEAQQKYSFALYWGLGKPIVHQRRKLSWSRIHRLGCVGFPERINCNISVYLLGHFSKRFLNPGSFIDISLQMISERNQLHLFI